MRRNLIVGAKFGRLVQTDNQMRNRFRYNRLRLFRPVNPTLTLMAILRYSPPHFKLVLYQMIFLI